MNLVIGGAFQGKEDFAIQKYRLKKEDVLQGQVCTMEELAGAKAVRDFHLFIRRFLEEGKDVSGLAEELVRQAPDITVISNELGYGVVPVDAGERAWREACGRICTKLAAQSKEVWRVVCGIGTRIK